MSADLPEVLARAAETCGQGAALTLAANFGGRELYFPAPDSIGEAHPLAQVLGLATARALAGVLGPGKVMIPMGPASTHHRRGALYRRLVDEDKSNAEIARRLGIHQRAVEYRRQRSRRARRDPNPTLFDD